MKTQVIRQVIFVNSNAETLFTTISVVTGALQCICDVISILRGIRNLSFQHYSLFSYFQIDFELNHVVYFDCGSV